jgi:hypothetical protein
VIAQHFLDRVPEKIGLRRELRPLVGQQQKLSVPSAIWLAVVSCPAK